MTQRNISTIARPSTAKIIAVGSPANRIAELINSNDHTCFNSLIVEPGTGEIEQDFSTHGKAESLKSASWLDDWYFEYESNVRDFVTDADVVYLVCGMGRDTGARIAPLIADTIRATNTVCVAFPIMPFGFEGRFRRHSAETALSELKRSSTVTVGVPANQPSVANLAGTVREVMTQIAVEIENSIEDFDRLFDRTNALSQVNQTWHRFSSTSEVVSGIGSSVHAGRDAVVSAVSNGTQLSEADSATLLVRGGIAMSFGQVAETLSTLHEWVTIHGDVGISVEHDQSLGSNIEVTVLLNKVEDAVVTAPHLSNFGVDRPRTAVEDLFNTGERDGSRIPELQPAI